MDDVVGRRELLIGCGSRQYKQTFLAEYQEWSNRTTIDMNPDHKPDVLWNLEKRPLPFDSNWFDEIHAYEVLEHIGTQGDWKSFFEEFAEYHRIMKPNGLFFASVPWWQGEWVWGDPGHRRVFTPGTLTFLDQDWYAEVGKSSRSDYRFIYKADFKLVHCEQKDTSMIFTLQAKKA